MIEEFKNPLNSIAKYVLIAITALVVIFLVLAFLRVGLVYWLWSTVDTWVTVRLGLDYYAAQLLTMIVVSLVIAVLPTMAWYMLLGRRKWQGTAAMIGGQALVFILVYTIGSGVCFDRRTGEALCWYADLPNGRYFSATPGFHPSLGIELKPYTRDVAIQSTPTSSSQVVDLQGHETLVSVRSTVLWTPSGVQVREGHRYVITASGLVTTDPNTRSPNTGPGGGSDVCNESSCLIPGVTYATLIARIGDGKPFKIGSTNELVATNSGLLFLSINDKDFGFNDNKGEFTVRIFSRSPLTSK